MSNHDGIDIGRACTNRCTRPGGVDGEVTIRVRHESGRSAIVTGRFVFAERRPPRALEPLWEAEDAADGTVIVRGAPKREAIAAAVQYLRGKM